MAPTPRGARRRAALARLALAPLLLALLAPTAAAGPVEPTSDARQHEHCVWRVLDFWIEICVRTPAVSGTGDADASEDTCVRIPGGSEPARTSWARVCVGSVAVSGQGASEGMLAVSGTGDAASPRSSGPSSELTCQESFLLAHGICVAGVSASGTGNATGGDASATGTGRSGGDVALSVAGEAAGCDTYDVGCGAVSGTGSASGRGFAVSGTGPAASPCSLCVAVSATCTASSYGFAVRGPIRACIDPI